MKKRTLCALLLMALCATSWGQEIRGTVVDDESGEPLAGVIVEAPYAGRRAATGLDGSFRLAVEADTATLHIIYIGYTPLTALAATGETTFRLTERARELSEVVVATVANGATEAAARLLERKASNVVNVLSERAMQLAPDLSVGNIIQKMSGVTVERNSTGEGQYAILRGMDKRYNYTLIDGAKLPSPDSKNRYVPLDLFPSEMLSRLEVHKSLTADLEGDGIGGAVNLVMKDAPREPLLQTSLQTGYNALFLSRPFRSFAHSDIQRHSPDEHTGQASGRRVAASDFSMAPLRAASRTPLPDLLASLTLGRRFASDRLGMLLGLCYQNLHRGKNMDYYNYTSSAREYERREYSSLKQRLGVHFKTDYRFSPLHSVEWYNGLIFMGEDQVRTAEAEKEADVRLRHNTQLIYTSRLSGRHLFADRRLTLSWRAIGAKAWNRTPDQTLLSFQGNHLQTNRAATRRWEHNSDRDLSAYLDLEYRLSNPWTLRFGAMYRDKQRASFFNEYTFDSATGSAQYQVYGTDWTNLDALRLEPRPYGNVGDPLNYDASERVGAAYVSAAFVRRGWKMVAGVRLEHTDQGYHLCYPRSVDADGRQRYYDVLPSFHLKRTLTSTMKLHLSYARATNRPSFFEIVPYSILGDDYKEKGNPALLRAVADNVDLRWELFPSGAEQVMVGVFYKHIRRPIEYSLISEGQDTYYVPMNTPSADNGGMEVDLTKYFHCFGIKANYTYTLSRTTTDKRTMEGDAVRTVRQTRPLFGQAAHVANLSLLYRDTPHGLNLQWTTSYIGRRLADVSLWLDNDIWENDYWRMELSGEKAWRCGVAVFLKATNLLNRPMVRYIHQGPHTEGVDAPRYRGNVLERKERYGQTVLIGIRYKL